MVVTRDNLKAPVVNAGFQTLKRINQALPKTSKSSKPTSRATQTTTPVAKLSTPTIEEATLSDHKQDEVFA